VTHECMTGEAKRKKSAKLSFHYPGFDASLG